MKNFVLSGLSVVGLLIGCVALLSPLPIGAIILAISFSTLISSSAYARLLLKKLRSRYGYIHRRFLWLEARLGKRLHRVRSAFLETHPDL